MLAREFLGFGYGFAAGAMLYLVADDVLPEGLESGESLGERSTRAWLAGGTVLGFALMAPLILIL